VKEVIVFVLLGLAQGGVFAGLATSVVLTYRGSGIVNMATGALAMVSAYALWGFRSNRFGFTLPTAVAVVAAVLAAVVVGVIGELVIFQRLRTASPLAKLLASLGVMLVLQQGARLWFGSGTKEIPNVLPKSNITVFDKTVQMNRFWMAGLVIVIGLLLGALFRWTRFGLATRAASENEVYGMLAGLAPNQLSMTNTLLASAVAGSVGIIAAPIAQADSGTLPLLIVPALGAALFARFTSLRIAAIAGILIGVLDSLIQLMVTKSWFPQAKRGPLPGVRALVIFLIIAGALYFRGRSLPTRGELIEKRLPAAPRTTRLAAPALVLGVVAVLMLIVLPFGYRQAFMLSLIGIVVCLSLVVITGFVGQASLVQVTLAGVAGFTVSRLAVSSGIGFPWGPLIGTVAAVVIGLVVGASALRVRGVSLAVATIAGVVAIEQFGFTNPSWGAGSTGSPVTQPSLFGVDLGSNASFRGIDGKLPSPVLGFVFVFAVVALCLLVANLRRSTLGQQMLAVRSNERAAAAAGVNVTRVKVAAYAISSIIAGTAGWMYAYNFGSVSAGRFGFLVALGFVAFAYIGGISMVSGAVVGGLFVTQGLVPYFFQQKLEISDSWAPFVGGLLLIFTLLQNPDGVAGTTYKKVMLKKRKTTVAGRSVPPAQAAARPQLQTTTGES
jgi:branched-chain amino acid transport system permease protein